MRAEDVEAVLSFWFGLDPRQWWRGSELDGTIHERFAALWEAERHKSVETFLGSAREALAGVILLDQFPRNMFRDTADSFATDPLALAITNGSLERGYDEGLGANERLFLYMPLQHSEDPADQDRSLALIGGLGLPDSARAAQLHHAMIARFGRFPHRNAILGRVSTPEERAAGNPEPW